MAENQHSTDTPDILATREGFDMALSEANIIVDIVKHLSELAISSSATPCASLYAWLAEELEARLEVIEIANVTMRRARA